MTTSFDARKLGDAWTEFWNGDVDQPILTGDFRIHFGGDTEFSLGGDAVRGGDAFAEYIRGFRNARPQTRFVVEADPIAQGDRFALQWGVQAGDVYKSGIDVLRVAGGRIAEVWSLTGARRM